MSDDKPPGVDHHYPRLMLASAAEMLDRGLAQIHMARQRLQHMGAKDWAQELLDHTRGVEKIYDRVKELADG